MNDLMPPPRRDLDDHDAVRAQLLRETRQTPARTRVPRWVLGGVAATVAAGVGAAAVVLVPSDGGSGNGKGPTLMPVAATQVLDRASKAAGGLPDVKPRGDQYLYMRSKSRQQWEGQKTGQLLNRTEWRSVDGRHASVVNQTGLGEIWLCGRSADFEAMAGRAKAAGHQPKVDLAKPPKGCHDTPIILAGLPATLKGMRSWLYGNAHGENPADVQAFLTLADTLRARYVSPSSLSLLFKAASTIPGVTVTRDVTDLAGRRGIAVGQSWNGRRNEIIFDAKSYRYLGERSYVHHKDSLSATPPPKPAPAVTPSVGAKIPEGQPLFSFALLSVGVTDKVKQDPR